MGASFSCPLSVTFDLENGFESVIASSIDHGKDDDKDCKSIRSLRFERKDSQLIRKLQSLNSNRFKVRKIQDMGFNEEVPSEDESACCEVTSPLPRSGSSVGGSSPLSPILDPNNPKHGAAVKLQKVYKSFRTRRKLADCAVLVEQSWWKLLDFAELKHSSISFFDLDKHESAISRWARARTRAAKIGKGLSKNCKAQKLALQHWLEAIDPRHRYGHNLHFYYVKWLNSQSKEPFFYWLDIGEGKEVNLVNKCPRSKLQQQCVKYLGPMERKAYEVALDDGKLYYKQTGDYLNTTKGSKWIFVLSTSKTLYVGKKKKGSFQHSSFLAGGATLAAGRIIAENGVLKAVWPHSGHYRPTPENFQDFLSFLRENNVDLSDVKLDPIDEEDGSIGKKRGDYLRSNSSEDEMAADKNSPEPNENDGETSSASTETNHKADETSQISKSMASRSFINNKPMALVIPSKDDLPEQLRIETQNSESTTNSFTSMSPTASETLQEPFVSEDDEAETIPEESVLKRINSHGETKSYQLGNHLSCRWSTGAGPRIGCLRDYPSGLQCHALEQVNLSPRSKRSRLKLETPSSLTSTPNSSSRNLSRNSSSRISRTQSSPMRKFR